MRPSLASLRLPVPFDAALLQVYVRLSGALMLRILSLREFEAVREALPCRAALRVDWVQPNKTVATVATLEAMPGLLQHEAACARNL